MTALPITETIAKMAHEIVRAYCQAIGDMSQPAWEDAPEWQKAGIRKGVEMHLANPHITPQESHIAWLEHKKNEGWKWGPVKSESLKEHPCCLPYESLPEAQKAKDHIFKAVVAQLTLVSLRTKRSLRTL